MDQITHYFSETWKLSILAQLSCLGQQYVKPQSQASTSGTKSTSPLFTSIIYLFNMEILEQLCHYSGRAKYSYLTGSPNTNS
jgi:hypothetical protein